MKGISKWFSALFAVAVLTAGLAAQTSGAARYDQDIQARVAKQLAEKKEFQQVQSSVEDGIVTLTGSVDIYQQKLDAAKKVRKLENVQGVRNQLEVSSRVPDEQLTATLDRKLYYDRMGYDNTFNFVTVSVKDGVATLGGETMSYMARDSAVSIANFLPGVKDVVNEIKVAPTSSFDDSIRMRALRAIYRDPVLGRYGSDPARPIRIVVNNGNLALYGTVESTMDKQLAGMRANQVFGAFKVENNLEVAKKS
ncbi:MAG: BON domain-containing protein [Acidobacteria bacterium]|jgi:osmotically-inducible protein OsmY|nr:BON domain-containing protein [Acidobacteriota bacterium]